MTENQKYWHKIKKLKKENPFFLHYAKTIDAINNIYVSTKLSREGLINIREELKGKLPCKMEIEIPAANGVELSREKNKAHIVQILKDNIRKDLFSNSLITSISLTENYLTEIIRIILQMHPGKLSMEVEAKSRKESQEDKKIDFKDILKASSLEDLYNQIINQRLYKLFYASPADYFNYLESTIQVKLKKSTIEDYIEIKATRDLLIHNHGKVNNIYIQKTGDKARTKDTRQTISINEDYFLKSTGVLKMVVRDSYEIATKKYLGKTRKGEMYPPNKPK